MYILDSLRPQSLRVDKMINPSNSPHGTLALLNASPRPSNSSLSQVK